LAIVATTAILALAVVVVGLASLQPKSKPQSVNELPVARFVYDADNLTVVFNASASSDPDGSIANYSWTFGDDTGAFGEAPRHVYAKNGTYNATLTVTDDKGGKNSTEKNLTVSKKVAPVTELKFVADIKIKVRHHGLTVKVSGAKSRAPENDSIVSYSWSFGDGATATGVNATHTYAANGTYNITLTVTDEKGATCSKTVKVHVETCPIHPPCPPPPCSHHEKAPPGCQHTIEIHKEKGDRNAGSHDHPDHHQCNHESRSDKHFSPP
jgi:PKD repeat protein